MRMRKKRHFDERYSQLHEMLIDIDKSFDKNTKTKVEAYINPTEIFGNSKPLVLEIGCGKGNFAIEFAKQNPTVNIIAVEKYANVLIDACEKAKKENLNNLRFMCTAAEYLDRYLRPQSITAIYLNFSCPFPKKKYAAHRLTHRRFLDIYRQIMQKDARIYQKTDNMQLFEFSIEQLSQNGYLLHNITLDLHNSKYLEGNIMTEYENKFTAQGKPIYRLEATLSEASL